MERQGINVNVGGSSGGSTRHRGTTSERPVTGMLPGFLYFDTTLGKPIWWNGIQWIDAFGNPIDNNNE